MSVSVSSPLDGDVQPSPSRSRARRTAGIVVAVIVAVALVVWANWFLQRYLILHDDTVRGERFGQTLDLKGSPSARSSQRYTQCKAAAESFYGHAILDGSGSAPPSERAFFVGCSGIGIGGYGGGGGD